MGSWQQADAPTLASLEQRTAEILQLAPATEMEHDLRWIEGVAKAPSKSLAVYVFRENGTVDGYAPFLIHPATLNYKLGNATLLRRRILRYVLVGGPVGDRSSEETIPELFRALRPQLRENDVVFLGAVKAGSVLADQLQRPSPLYRDYHVLPYGPAYQRRRIRFESNDYEAYLRSLRKTTRRDLKRSERKFLARAKGRYHTRRFETPAEAELFLQHATEVSKKTYQWHLLGLGMRDQEDRGTNFRHAAREGWFRSYILYVDDRPIAFQAGYLHRHAYYAHNTGYDPEWRDAHAGRFLLAQIFEDLLADEDPVEVFDFLWGDDLLKARLANTERTERHYYLFPRSLHGALLYYPLTLLIRMTAAASAVLERLRLKDYARRLIRRRSVK